MLSLSVTVQEVIIQKQTTMEPQFSTKTAKEENTTKPIEFPTNATKHIVVTVDVKMQPFVIFAEEKKSEIKWSGLAMTKNMVQDGIV